MTAVDRERNPAAVCWRLEGYDGVFLQQLINGLTLGAVYGLIAIGYTMVYGIIGMINFAHGEVYMIGSYVSFMIIAALMMMGIDTSWLLVAAGFVGAIVIASAYGWSIERVAYRPVRNSKRLIALISAIGMSIFLQNYVSLTGAPATWRCRACLTASGSSATATASPRRSPPCNW